MTNEATRLAACPFCGESDARVDDAGEMPIGHGEWQLLYVVHCGCGVEGTTCNTPAFAIEAWNRRATLAQPAVSEDARDAARYRWLRAQHWSDKTLTVANPKSVGLGCMTYGREGLDAAIDAAMASPEKPHD